MFWKNLGMLVKFNDFLVTKLNTLSHICRLNRCLYLVLPNKFVNIQNQINLLFFFIATDKLNYVVAISCMTDFYAHLQTIKIPSIPTELNEMLFHEKFRSTW